MKRLLQRSIVLLTIGVCVLVIGIAVAAAQGPGNTEPAQPTPIPQTKITMVAGNAATGVGMEVETSIRQALAHARDDNVLPTVNYFAISAPPWVADKWLFISVVAFEKLDAKLGWKLDDASWFGVVLIHQDDSGRLTAAVEGTIEFSQFLVQVPETILSAEAKQHLDPLQRSLMSSAAYRFPWQSGTRMQYGSLGVHSAGYGPTWGTWDWKAVDFVSDGSAGRAPNRLLAAATGAIGGVCNDGTSVAIKVDNLIYAHLLNNSNLHTGHYFDQGYVIGVLKTGTFHWPTPPPGSCGRASQAANNFHVHWGFPNNTFQVEGWTLNPSDGSSAQWRRGNETVGVTGWMLAGSGGGQPPAAPSNLSATVVSSSQINLSWQDNSNNETGFKVERKTGAGGTWNEIATVGTGVRTYQNTGLAANTTYYYRVRAYNSYGNSAYSNEAGATTPNITCPVYRAAYYDNRNLSGSPKFIQCEDWPINHDWGSGGPGNGVGNDNFSARWTGRASIAAGTYTFIAGADDGIKVWLDGQVIINEWRDQGYTEYRVNRSFSNSGYHDIQVEYYENGGAARVFFKWEQAQPQAQNLALNKPTSATSWESGQYVPFKGTDGRLDTRWSSSISSSLGPQWFKVDLGSRQTFNRFVVRWEAAYAAHYWMAWSDDGVNYSGYQRTLNSPQTDSYTFPPQTHRYVAIYMDQRAPRMNNYSLWEFEVYNVAGVQTTEAEDQPLLLPALPEPLPGLTPNSSP